ncbi:MAG: Cystathionine beta-lyase PatB [Lentisphaerae bacterium ADurb.Bin242]|nr:MAG: Cystathionine beta-lyase PatB [Lentisphaerae bacterium ADurb.Bin242]
MNMIYDFDKVIPRKHTNSLKFDFAAERGRPADILPLWVADMDFQAPREVIDALVEKSRHGIFGYSEPDKEYFSAISDWFRTQHGWNIDPRHIVRTPGVVFSLCTLIRTVTRPGEAVLIQEPVYYPFRRSIRDNQRKLVVSELVFEKGKYRMDFADFERKIIDSQVKLFLLCSPHNPVGRVWTKEELAEIGRICVRHGVFVAADEIHQDFIYPGYRHTVFSEIDSSFREISALCTAPSKTFNLAGLHISNTFIADPKIRQEFKDELDRAGYSQSNIMGLIACQAAYRHGASWLGQLKDYLTGNLNYFRDFLEMRLPELKLVEPEGTYLVWVDFSALGMSVPELENFVVRKASLWLDGGHIFGKSGCGFQRFNIACPRAILRQALEQLESAVRSRN